MFSNLAMVVTTALVAMSIYHFYASGFALIRELLHRGIHLSFVIGLAFLLFSYKRSATTALPSPSWFRFESVNILDIIFSIMGVTCVLYLPLLPP